MPAYRMGRLGTGVCTVPWAQLGYGSCKLRLVGRAVLAVGMGLAAGLACNGHTGQFGSGLRTGKTDP